MKTVFSAIYLIVVLLCGWLLARHSGVPSFLLPAPQAVLEALWLHRQLLWHHALYTLAEIVLALLLGVGAGVTLAVLMAASTLLRRVLFPLVTASQAIPVFALAPLLVLWLGFCIASKVVVAALILFFPLCLSLFDGLCRTPVGWLELAQTSTSSRFRIFWRVRWPAALPQFFSGLQMAVVLAPIGVVIGEWVGASEGLGYLMMQSNARLEIATSFAALLLLLILALLLSGSVALMRKKILWQST
ncbi:ABC transporter permease [Pantoea sp. PNT03]|uniref:ABC transporter permease n=1 Tax=Pantoea sp. PNT03 TaxID=2769258 RepID=UPI00177F1CF9|nr:ABC transporter permease [Pantoea sp. PNT03]MBD9659471.1 ABC transporter permease [Pantoea sp. PNT03]